jgi:hypothetical protein
MQTPIESPQPQQKSNRNIIIAVVVGVLLCCCCLTFAVAGYYGYQAYRAAKNAINGFEVPTDIPLDPNNPTSPSIPIPSFDSSDAPQGGLSDSTTRVTAWTTLQLIAAISGCTTPTADGSTIKIIQEPDSVGIWVEEWDVPCGDGSSQLFKVTFTPENGFVSVNVEVP